MKRLLGLVTLMVAIFGFNAGAFAAFGDPICMSCKGNTKLRNVPLYTAAEQTKAACVAFDYDENTAAIVNGDGDGYCAPHNTTNYRAIFAVCNCELSQASKLVPGFHVGIRMEILVNNKSGANGAYWSAPHVGQIFFQNFISQTDACKGSSQPKTFGNVGYFLSDGATAVTTLTADLTCTVPDASKATILRTAQGTGLGYIVTEADVNLAYWWIDIPPIRLDPAKVAVGDVISVKISLYNAEQTPVCPDCLVPICECIIEVAKVGCDPTKQTLRFPYFTSLAEGDYWNGIVIGNPNAKVGTCALTAHGKDGVAVATASASVPATGLFVDLLELMTWSGSFDAACYIDANCTFNDVFGFAMMADAKLGVRSMGYLPLQNVSPK